MVAAIDVANKAVALRKQPLAGKCQYYVGLTIAAYLGRQTAPGGYASANDAYNHSAIVSKNPLDAQVGDNVFFDYGVYGHVGTVIGRDLFVSATANKAGFVLDLGHGVFISTITGYSNSRKYKGNSRRNGTRAAMTGMTPWSVPRPPSAGGIKNRITPNATFKKVLGDKVYYYEPTGELMKRIQRGLAALGEYYYDTRRNAIDGNGGINTRKGIQKYLKAKGLYKGVIDGRLGINNLKQIQTAGQNWGGYTNNIDGVLFGESWSGLATALGQ